MSITVVKDLDSVKKCMFAEKQWVNAKNINTAKEYENGDFLRVWCIHDQCWCSAEYGADCCCIFNDHKID